MTQFFSSYISRLTAATEAMDHAAVDALADSLHRAWSQGRQVFLCGNGGSAGNAIHIANDLMYGVNRMQGEGLKVHALPANQAIVTCLANDEGYAEIYAKQLTVYAQPGDVLVVLSGSGNSPNILRALEEGNRIGLETFAVLGYSGGKAKDLAQTPIHFAIDDMQIAEDLQLILFHATMQHLSQNVPQSRQAVPANLCA